MKHRKDSTRHSNEWELYNSSTVSARAVVPSSSRPQRYGIAALPTDGSGDGDLFWPTMDADEFGSSGPRSLERRSSSNGERFQIHGFDGSASALDSSEVVQVCVRRRFGSSGNHYTAFVNSSDLVTQPDPFPRWDQINDATGNVDARPSTSGTTDFVFGSVRRWQDITAFASRTFTAQAGGAIGSSAGGDLIITTDTLGGSLPDVWLRSANTMLISAESDMTISTSGILTISTSNAIITGIPRQGAAPAGPAGTLWIDTGNSNVLKAV